LLIEIVAQPQISSDAYNTGACLGNNIPPFEMSGNYDSQAYVQFYQSNSLNSYNGTELSSTNFAPNSNTLGNFDYFFTYTINYPGCLADTSNFYGVTITDAPQLELGSSEPVVGCVDAEIDLTNFVAPNLNNNFILVWNFDNALTDTIIASTSYTTPTIETVGNHNMNVQMYSTLQNCATFDEIDISISIVEDPFISEEQNFIQALCPFEVDIDAPTVLLNFDNLIGPPTYTWYQIDQNNTFLISNSNNNYYLPVLPISGEFDSQCVIQFEYPGCNVLASSIAQLTFEGNNLDCFPELEIPEAISPNNDGVNDYWTIAGLEQFNGFEINIFNGFGQNVFQVKNIDPIWDGTWDGKTLPNGDYFYSIKLIELNRTIFGTISIAK
jgi:gliding motility-associated-like protein